MLLTFTSPFLILASPPITCYALSSTYSPSYVEEEMMSTTSYIFTVELVQEDDGRWSAGVPALPGCATCGFTKEEAMRNIRDAVEAYLRAMQKGGEEIPSDDAIRVLHEPVVAITV